MLVRSGGMGDAPAVQAAAARAAHGASCRARRRSRASSAERAAPPASARASRRSAEAVAEKRAEARMKGYVGEACPECGNFTMVRNGTCLKCDTCGGTTGCS